MDIPDGKFTLELVDDQALVRDGMAALLENAEGIELVATAGGLDEALQFAEQFKPRVLLMDVLAEPTLFDRTKSVLDRCPETVLVVLDDSPVDANVREALRIGAAAYLTKQQPFGQIDAALRLAARGNRVYAPEVARRLVLSAEGVRLAAEDKSHPLSELTPREMDVLINLARGSSVKQCAKNLGIGVSTVGNHKSRLMKKLNVHKTVELVHLAMKQGIVRAGSVANAETQH
jgi:DNA-binding NarL/FixJ family response regulator